MPASSEGTCLLVGRVFARAAATSARGGRRL